MPNKTTLKEAIDILKRVHGDSVILVESTYVSRGCYATFMDRKYGEFVSQAHHVFSGLRHPDYSIQKQKNTCKRKGIERLKRDIFEKHNSLVKLIEESYINLTTMCIFEDSEYGKWKGLPITVKNGGRHPDYRKAVKAEKFSTPSNELKLKLFKIHGSTVDIYWDTFRGIRKKIRAVDKEYGEWWPTVASLLDGKRHKKRAFKEEQIKLEEIEKRLFRIHGNQVTIKKDTYCGSGSTATFIDIKYGEWKANVSNVIGRGSSHPKREAEKIKRTCLERYGVDSPNKVPEISLRKAKSQTKSEIKIHWKTGKDLICQASYEPKVVDYLNNNKIDFLWQAQTFTMPNGKTYRPDLLLLEQNIWIEIKGFFRKDALEKWNWFKTQFPTAELWNEPKLKEMKIL